MFRLALSRHIYFFAFRDTNRDTSSYCALNAWEQVSVDIVDGSFSIYVRFLWAGVTQADESQEEPK